MELAHAMSYEGGAFSEVGLAFHVAGIKNILVQGLTVVTVLIYGEQYG